eukprot:610748-Hanusia_phi.AAC.1
MRGVKHCESSFNFTYIGEASIRTIKPSAVYVTGGNSLTLSGRFTQANRFQLTVGDRAMACEVRDSQNAICIASPHSKGAYRLTTSSHSIEIHPECVLRYVDIPSVSNIHPSSGPTYGGTPLVLEGENFEVGMIQCAFARQRVWASVRSSTLCECIAPASVDDGGLKDLRIITTGIDYVLAERGYLYYEPPRIDQIDPTAARVGQVGKITIFGRHFDKECVIKLGTRRVDVSNFVSSTMTVVSMPPIAGTALQGNMTVGISRNGVDFDSLGFGYESTSGFVVMKIEPSVGYVDGGGLIRVEGYGPRRKSVTVYFGTRQASCNMTSEWEASCLSPRGEIGR